MASALVSARAAFDRRAWTDAMAAYLAAGECESLDAADSERLAVCAYLLGRDEDCARAWEAAHRCALATGDAAEAARHAFWLGLSRMLRGQSAQAGGWLARAEKLVTEAASESAAAGYLLIPALLGALEGGDPRSACVLAERATGIGGRLGDADLHAFGTLGHGQALIAAGETAAGFAKLDEVMVAVIADELGPITAGIVYCAAILECVQQFDLARAAEWTRALSDWCGAQPDLVPYRGQCLVHRSQLQQFAGEWAAAGASATAACRRLSEEFHPAVGMAYYQQAELHRLVGDVEAAEQSYREAGRHGYDPMPGLALLHLGRGDAAGAAATIRRVLAETAEPAGRPALLSAAVEILLAAGDTAGARAAADELAVTAAVSSATVLAAMSAEATGAVLVAEGGFADGLSELRAAATIWQTLRMPYHAARVAVLVGTACAALEDVASARLEFGSAHDTFTALGAAPDLERLAALSRSEPRPVGSLTKRECEVLTLVAAGRTNREIATELTLSQHTVGRHVENIFGKLGVTTRAMAIAKAFEHRLL